MKSVTVHPRGRGEHGHGRRVGPGAGGSSPRARGTRGGPAGGGARARFIPAGAGNTRPSTPPRGPWAVHPRGRGEHAPLRSRPSWRAGSSPRARGTLLLQPNGFIGLFSNPFSYRTKCPKMAHPLPPKPHLLGLPQSLPPPSLPSHRPECFPRVSSRS